MIQEKCRSGAMVVRLFAATAFAILPGCMCLRSSCPGVTPACQQKCDAMPRECRGNVYAFLVQGFDPFDVAGVGDVKSALNNLGFKVYSGQFYHGSTFADEIKEIALADANARFVVVGIGAGVDAAVSLADTVWDSGVTIDLLACVDSPFWSNAPGEKPVNVRRVLSLHGPGDSWLPSMAGIEDDITLPDVGWLGVSSHSLTVETLATELASIAGAVPTENPETPAASQETPVPRPDATPAATLAVSRTFLDPATTLEGRDHGRGSVPAVPARLESGR